MDIQRPTRMQTSCVINPKDLTCLIFCFRNTLLHTEICECLRLSVSVPMLFCRLLVLTKGSWPPLLVGSLSLFYTRAPNLASSWLFSISSLFLLQSLSRSNETTRKNTSCFLFKFLCLENTVFMSMNEFDLRFIVFSRAFDQVCCKG